MPVYTIEASVPKGDGTLQLLETGERIAGVSAPSQIELILDASGSMRGRAKGKITKMEAARRVMRKVIAGLPDNVQVGLRVYGHRFHRTPKTKSCQDSQLIVPFGPVDKPALLKAVKTIRPRGQTPIGLSLACLEKDFGGSPGQKLVVLVTDGIETCADKPGHVNHPPKVVKRLMDKGLKFRVNVVGFDIGESKTRDFLSELASMSGGGYYAAGSTDELEAAIQQAMRTPFKVMDAKGEVFAQGAIGNPPLALPEGSYRVSIAATNPLTVPEVRIELNRATRVFLNKEGREVGIEKKVVDPSVPLPEGVRAHRRPPGR